MQFMNLDGVRKQSVPGLLAACVLLASCGESGLPSNPGSGAAPGGAPAPGATSHLTISVTDPEGNPLPDAEVVVNSVVTPPSVYLGHRITSRTDRNGLTSVDAVTERISICVHHPLGDNCIAEVTLRFGQSWATTVVVHPLSPTTAALLPVTVVPGSVSADRSAMEIRVSVVGTQAAPFMPSSWGTYSTWPPASGWAPMLSLGSCAVWLDSKRVTPDCFDGFDDAVFVADFGVSSFTYDPVEEWEANPELGPFSALLLLDQSRRAAELDPYNLRNRGAKHFIQLARPADLIGVAGFAGPGGDASWPPLLPELPVWTPSGTGSVFSSDRAAKGLAVDTLKPQVGGASPLLSALSAAMTLTATQTTGTGRRAIVALVSGGDDSVLTPVQRQAALAALRQQQSDADIQVILIAFRLSTANLSDRQKLAELAWVLRAPIIYAGYPENSRIGGDGLYAAFDLAAGLLAGRALPTVDAVFQVRTAAPGGFQAGTAYNSVIFVETEPCDFVNADCTRLPLQFSAPIP